jgi:hypothetical protein
MGAAATLFIRILDDLWALGGAGSATDLGLDEYGSRGYEPCPREAEYPCCEHPEKYTCLIRPNCLPCSPTRPYR